MDVDVNIIYLWNIYGLVWYMDIVVTSKIKK